MNSSFGDNKKRLGSSASSVTEAKRRATVAQTWDFASKQPRIPSASFSTTVQGMQSSTLAFQNARNSGVVPRIDLVVDVPTKSLTATVAATPFAPVRIVGSVAISDTPIFSISPALPLGLSFSTVDGSISGTPMETITTTAFTVTVSATSIYPTPYSTSTTFYLTIGDSAASLLYQGYTGVPLSTGLPTIDSPSNTWGTRDDTLIPNILSGAANQLFNAESIPSEQNIAGYFYGYFKAPETGTYTFGYNSDDGIELLVNGTKVVNAPGSSGVHSGTSSPALSLIRNTYYPIQGLWSQGGGPGFLAFNALNIGGVNKISTYPIKSYFFH